MNELLERVTQFLRDEAKTETLIGKQFQLGEYTCVPVIALGMGFGRGGGEGNDKAKGEGTGAGGGAGIGMTPKGFLVTKGSEIQFISASTSKGLSAAFEKVPDLIAKYMETKAAEKKEDSAKD